MDIEQFKLVLETLQSVSHDASSLAVLWLWLKFGAQIAVHVFWGAIVIGVAYFIYRMVRASTGEDATTQFLREMRDQLRTGTGGCLTDNERHNTIAALRTLVAEKKLKDKNQ